MGQMHELLAVVAQRKGAATSILQETAKVFHSKHDLFNGLMKTFTPLAEDAETVTEDVVPLTTTVGERLAYTATMMKPWLDAAFQIDCTNMGATAPLSFGGRATPNVPATFLMQLVKRLDEIRNACILAPTLDPKIEWVRDEDAGRGRHKSISPERRNKTQKVMRTITIAPATEHHPEQAQLINEDVVVGHLDTQRHSGAITPLEKHTLLARIDTLQAAAKKALAQANQTEHKTGRIAEDIFGYLFDGLV